MIFADHHAWIEWQREYFKLAGAVLSCHLAYQGGRSFGKGYGDLHRYDPVSVLIGDLSYGAEMYLMIKEARGERTRIA